MTDGAVAGQEPLPAWSEPFTDEMLAGLARRRPLERIDRDWAFGGGDRARRDRRASSTAGVEADHPAVAGRVVESVAVELVDGEPNVVTDEPGDLFGHGTACGGIILGLAPEVELVSIRVLGATSRARATAFLAGPRVGHRAWRRASSTSACPRRARRCSRIFHEVVDEAYFKGVKLVSAANNVQVASYPSLFSSVFSVAAHGRAGPVALVLQPARRRSSSAPGAWTCRSPGRTAARPSRPATASPRRISPGWSRASARRTRASRRSRPRRSSRRPPTARSRRSRPATESTSRRGPEMSDGPQRATPRAARARLDSIALPMTDRRRFYLTTAIAYANNRPGLHTLYEVIGADVIARWHRMSGDDTRFLTGTDEHSVNIATTAPCASRARGLRRRDGRPVPRRRGRARDRARPLHPDDRPRPRARGPGDGPPRPRQRRHLPRHVRGLVLPERGLPQHERPRRGRDAASTARTIPTSPLQWLTERNWFFRLSAYQERLERRIRRRTPDGCSPSTAATRCSASSARASRTSRSAARALHWGIPFPLLPDGSVGAASRRLAGTPPPASSTSGSTRSSTTSRAPASPTTRRRSTTGGRPTSTSSARTSTGFHTIYWPAMLMSAGLAAAAPRLGPRLAARPGRADEQEPRQLPRPERSWPRSARTGPATPRCARSPSTATAEVSWDSFVRRYNADLANDYGNLAQPHRSR